MLFFRESLWCSSFVEHLRYRHALTEFIAHAQVNPIHRNVGQLTCPAQATYLFTWATLFIKQTRTHITDITYIYINNTKCRPTFGYGVGVDVDVGALSTLGGGGGAAIKRQTDQSRAECWKSLWWASAVTDCRDYCRLSLWVTPDPRPHHPHLPSSPVALHTHSFIHHWVNQSKHTHSHHTLTLIVFQLLILIWFLILILIVILNYNWQQEAEEAEPVVRCSGVALGDWSNCSKSIFVPMCLHCISADFDYTTQHNCEP